jgi:DNA-binding LacI/PurR family transcriptional regulator
MAANRGTDEAANGVAAAGQYATRPPTMKDVAAAAGVSKALVSMIFREAAGPNAQTRVRVLETAERLGYRRNRTASLLARRRGRHLGVAMSVHSAFHAELVDNVQAVADELGYEIVLGAVTRTHNEQRAVETLLEYRCEALLLLGPELPAAALHALAEQVPVVVIGRRMSRGPADVVRTADADGLRQVVDHLVALGHRRVVYVDSGSGRISADRRHGYESAMRRHGLAPHSVHGGPTEADGAAAAAQILALDPRPTAVAAYNDHCAVGILDRLRRSGIEIPAMMSVVGFDDSPISRLAHLDLTTISQEPEEQARLAVRAAVDRLEGVRGEVRDTVLKPRLVVRGSTAPPRVAP